MTDLSCREQVVAAIVALLAAVPVAGVTVERNRAEPVTGDLCPHLVVEEGREVEQADFVGEWTFTLTVEVSGYVTGGTAAEAAARANELRGRVDQLILADPSLGGLARAIEIDPEAEPVPLHLTGDGPAVCFARAYAVDYATRQGDPFTFA